MNAAAFGTHRLCTAVPSRLYFEKTPEKPLAGLRIAVKDLFNLKGVHTGCGNRAYRRLYRPSTDTSAAVQAAKDKGAIVVGKTKTAGFGGSQEVVRDWVAYSYPFNARRDGYLAAYPWLDLTLGSDSAFDSFLEKSLLFYFADRCPLSFQLEVVLGTLLWLKQSTGSDLPTTGRRHLAPFLLARKFIYCRG